MCIRDSTWPEGSVQFFSAPHQQGYFTNVSATLVLPRAEQKFEDGALIAVQPVGTCETGRGYEMSYPGSEDAHPVGTWRSAEATGGTFTEADDAGSLTEQLRIQTTRAFQGYEAEGDEVTGGTNVAGAVELLPGQYVTELTSGERPIGLSSRTSVSYTHLTLPTKA